MKHKINSDCEN